MNNTNELELSRSFLWAIENSFNSIGWELVLALILFYFFTLSFCLLALFYFFYIVYSKRSLQKTLNLERQSHAQTLEKLKRLEKRSRRPKNPKPRRKFKTVNAGHQTVEYPELWEDIPEALEGDPPEAAQDPPEPTATLHKKTYTEDELDQYPTFSPSPFVLDSDARIEAYQNLNGSRRYIVASGPKRFCRYRIISARLCTIGGDKSEVPQVAPYKGCRDSEGSVCIGVAYIDDVGAGYRVINPDRRSLDGESPKHMPITYVKVQWGDGGISWETRTDMRKLWGGAMADNCIYNAAKKSEKDAKAFREENPDWGKRAAKKESGDGDSKDSVV